MDALLSTATVLGQFRCANAALLTAFHCEFRTCFADSGCRRRMSPCDGSFAGGLRATADVVRCFRELAGVPGLGAAPAPASPGRAAPSLDAMLAASPRQSLVPSGAVHAAASLASLSAAAAMLPSPPRDPLASALATQRRASHAAAGASPATASGASAKRPARDSFLAGPSRQNPRFRERADDGDDDEY